MVWIDYAIIAVIAFSSLVSLIRGFVREALSLVTWGCAFFVASHYYTYLSVWFTGFEDGWFEMELPSRYCLSLP